MSARDLGADRAITRRDFLNGAALAAGGALLPAARAAAAPDDDPPARTGLRGSQPGVEQAAHQLRDGQGPALGDSISTDAPYDLIVVGGGISGLAAAYFYRQRAGRPVRVLILDNHDDFGGHARRNELGARGRALLLNGGTQEIEAPSQYAPVARDLLRQIGVAPRRFYAAAHATDQRHLAGLRAAAFFDRETFGQDRLVVGAPEIAAAATPTAAWADFAARAPLPPQAQADLARLSRPDQPDYLAGLSDAQKKERLARTSYNDYLLKIARVHPLVARYLQTRTHELFCAGSDAVPALFCWNMGYPGFHGLRLGPTPPEQLSGEPGGQHGRESQARASAGDPLIHFPDGNATVARLLVRALRPDVVPGSTMEDVVTARVAYARLDRADAPVRIRLSSTVMRVQHRGDAATAREVEVCYARGGKLYRVVGRGCVLACWHSVIPYLCPELPAAQREALAHNVKQPIVYTSVLLRDWQAFHRLGMNAVYAPGGYHHSIELATPTHLGAYRPAYAPDQPMLLHLERTPCRPGLPKKEQHRVGRAELLATPFSHFELQIRQQLARTLAGGGFDPARDILAITVNRWPHGYSYTYNSLYDPMEWVFGAPDDRPCVRARRRHGRIAIANADAAASPHSDAAILMADRAISELLG